MTRHRNIGRFIFWDWRSIRITILTLIIFTVVLIVFFRIRGFARDRYGKDMTVRTKGILLSTETIEERRQGKLGTRTISAAIKINYQYTVNPSFSTETAEILIGWDIIPIESEFYSFFESIKKNPNRMLLIKLNPHDPLKSQIDTEN